MDTRCFSPTRLRDTQLGFFRANGYLVVERLLPEEFLGGLAEIVNDLADEQVKDWMDRGLLDCEFATLGSPSRSYQAWCAAGMPDLPSTPDNSRFVARAGDGYILNEMVTGLASQLLGSTRIEPLLAHCFYRNKFPNQDNTTVPWHQDAQCLKALAGCDFVTIWIPLVDISEENSCLEISPVGPAQDVLPGTFSPQTKYVCMRESGVEQLPATQRITLRRGDVLCLSPFLPHRSTENLSNEARWSIDLRYRAARTT